MSLNIQNWISNPQNLDIFSIKSVLFNFIGFNIQNPISFYATYSHFMKNNDLNIQKLTP